MISARVALRSERSESQESWLERGVSLMNESRRVELSGHKYRRDQVDNMCCDVHESWAEVKVVIRCFVDPDMLPMPYLWRAADAAGREKTVSALML
jgi:hypothetical protein